MPNESMPLPEVTSETDDSLTSMILDEAVARWEESPELAIVCCVEER